MKSRRHFLMTLYCLFDHELKSWIRWDDVEQYQWPSSCLNGSGLVWVGE